MIKQILEYLRAYSRGDEAHLDITIRFTWLDLLCFVIVLAMLAYLIYLLCHK